jgi:uncharacterized protein YvpB
MLENVKEASENIKEASKDVKEISLSEITKIQTPDKLISVPYINQDKIVYGCEAVSATMLLQFHGYRISEKSFTDNYLIQKDWYTDEEGNSYGPDPNAAYPGSPYIENGENCGFGSYAPSTAKSIDKVLDFSKHETRVISGMNLNDIVTNYINKDIPVLIWVTMNMRKSVSGHSWIINFTSKDSPYKIGDTFTWTRGEHCVVFVGHNEEYYFFNDPLDNNGLIAYEKHLVEKRYRELGKQSLVVLGKEN